MAVLEVENQKEIFQSLVNILVCIFLINGICFVFFHSLIIFFSLRIHSEHPVNKYKSSGATK
jgi:hypothetical protein